MHSSLTQQNFPNASSAAATFASDPTSTVEKPGNPYYQYGVDVGYTAPAKWWNWFWNHISAWFASSKADKNAIHTELLNVLSTAVITPADEKTNQLSKAIDTIGYTACVTYDNAEEDGHKANQPYVVGFTLYIPETELL
jgi:hypothetical protein